MILFARMSSKTVGRRRWEAPNFSVCQRVATPIGVETPSPIYAMRHALLENKRLRLDQDQSHGRLPTYHILWFLIVALSLEEPFRVFEEETIDKHWLVGKAEEIKGEVKEAAGKAAEGRAKLKNPSAARKTRARRNRRRRAAVPLVTVSRRTDACEPENSGRMSWSRQIRGAWRSWRRPPR